MPPASKPKAKQRLVRKGSVVLTEKQDKLVEGILNNKSNRQAAKEAGYNVDGVHTAVNAPDVQQALKECRSELATATKVTREKVVAMFELAFEMATTAAETAVMVAAARELGRMHGFYEPETIKHELTYSQARLESKFKSMSRHELLQIADGKALIVDGEFKQVEEAHVQH